MPATFNEVILLTISAVVGFGLSHSMGKVGISLFSRKSWVNNLCILCISCSAWIISLTLLSVFFGE